MRLLATLLPLLALSGIAEAFDKGISQLVVISTYNIDLDTAAETWPQAKRGPSLSQELVELLEAGGHTVHDRAKAPQDPSGEQTEIGIAEAISRTDANRSCSALRTRLDEIFADRIYGKGALFASEALHNQTLRVVASPNMCCELSRVVGSPSGTIYRQGILFTADWTKAETKDMARLCAAKAVATW